MRNKTKMLKMCTMCINTWWVILILLHCLHQCPATFFIGGPDGCQEIDSRPQCTILVCSDIMFVAACIDQCPVGLVPFRKCWSLTLKLKMNNDAVCLVV